MLSIIVLAWLAGAAITFVVWLGSAVRARARNLRQMWIPAVLTAAAWPLVVIAGAAAWIGGLFAARR